MVIGKNKQNTKLPNLNLIYLIVSIKKKQLKLPWLVVHQSMRAMFMQEIQIQVTMGLFVMMALEILM